MTESVPASMFGVMPLLVPPSPVDPLIILFLGLALEALVGSMGLVFRLVPHPVAALSRFIESLERRLNREERSEETRARRGAALTVFIVILAALTGWAVLLVIRGFTFGWLVELFFIATLIAQRSSYRRAVSVVRALERGGLAEGRVVASGVIGRATDSLDEQGLSRATIEVLFRNFADRAIAPIFWYVIAGLPGLFVSRAIETLDRRIGHSGARYVAFGRATARLDTVLNYIPARLAGLIISIAAAFTPTATPLGSFRIMWRDAEKHRSTNAGWPESAAAGALGLSLGGPPPVGGDGREPWVGDGRARATIADIRRALFLFVAACLFAALLVGILAVVRDAAIDY